MSRPGPEDFDDFAESDPIDLDRLTVDSEYRRAVMWRLRREAEAERRMLGTSSESPSDPEPSKD